VGPPELYTESRMERVGPPDKSPRGMGGPTKIIYILCMERVGPPRLFAKQYRTH
jgi:hypothetical protein